MAELKTKLNNASVEEFLNSVKDEKKREFAYIILDIIKRIKVTEKEIGFLPDFLLGNMP